MAPKKKPKAWPGLPLALLAIAIALAARLVDAFPSIVISACSRFATDGNLSTCLQRLLP